MSRYVYTSRKQYNTVEELEYAIFEAWEKSNLNTAVTMRDSMRKSSIDMLQKNGAIVDY